MVEYARALHIEVIPEIEMPGHSEEVLAVFPELSCSGKPYLNSDFCIGNEQTFEFLENVLSEVIGLFPSEYIHIGGDEASKQGWRTCPKCAARMRKEGLKDVDELQSYMIRRIETFWAGTRFSKGDLRPTPRSCRGAAPRAASPLPPPDIMPS